ncbi:MAG: diphthine--ammonia ligase [Holophagales bacterium]|jgi:uncharacterized protein (TIGR00290 family)|nr:diphthine--ammonia ligase [Holophagales bacterium]
MNQPDLRGKKFVASYSGGKDSVLAIYRSIKSGLLPLGMITTYNIDAGRSWFHGVSENLIRLASDSLSMPVAIVKTTNKQYEENFEKALDEAKNKGAEVCVFGDIDIEGHFEWCSQRCKNVGLLPFFPLWNEERKKLVYEFIKNGFSTIIIVVNTDLLPKNFLGQILTCEVADSIEKCGADVCGENGEYHTFTFDGPLFSNSVNFIVKDCVDQDKYAILNIEAGSGASNSSQANMETV